MATQRTTGRTLALSPPRIWIDDLMRASRSVPLVSFERIMALGPVESARQAVPTRPGWCSLFVKAFALVAARRPELRRAYISFPWAHLYEHPISIASVAVERDWCGEPGVFFTQFREPDQQSLVELDAELDRAKTAPVTSYPSYRRLLRMASLPGPLRRWAWWFALVGFGGMRRARYVGTFGVSVTAGLGASALALQTPLTSTLHYGSLDAAGQMPVRLTFDHRVLDGGPVARALVDLEQTLNGPIREELLALPHRQAA
jgi:hypothetical protein